MTETFTYYRNALIHWFYQTLLKPIFFLNDPEFVHDHMVMMGRLLGGFGFGRWVTGLMFGYQNKMLEQQVLGIDFRNPIGLSAGFDKNAELTDIMPSVGFGFVEIGSITGEPCPGNPKPRLWRLPKSKSLLVYYGLKSDGCEALAARLRTRKLRIPFGMSVAMANSVENLDVQKGIVDFAYAFKTMESRGSYVTVNISCPNTQGGQPFMIPGNLEALLTTLDAIPTAKPIFVKLSPDLSTTELDALLDIIRAHRVQGIICTNLTKNRDNPKILDQSVPTVGGMSGKVVQELSDNMLAYIRKREGTRFVLVGLGGVFSAEDAYKKIRLGATLVQMLTGMIYEGPQVVGAINQGLVKLLQRDGFTHISQAVGVDIEADI